MAECYTILHNLILCEACGKVTSDLEFVGELVHH